VTGFFHFRRAGLKCKQITSAITMPYIHRNADASIESLHRHAEHDAQEFLDDDHAEVQAFVGRAAPDSGDFSSLDADFVRVIEDVIDALLSKNVINATDLPAEAQAKLFARKTFRDRASRNSLNLFAPFGSDDVI
jgi:hypothetical protein